MSKLVLIDFDGVVLRNEISNQYLSDRAKSYVSYKTNIRNVSHFANDLYVTHGHTHIGLDRHKYASSLREFNSYMYGDENLYAHLQMSFYEQKKWLEFKQSLDTNNIDIKFFSNSPSKWLEHFIKYNISDIFDFSKHIEKFSINDKMYNLMLKPQPLVYNIADIKYGEIYSEIFFIDDKLANLHAAADTNWIKILFDASCEFEKVDEHFYYANSLTAISERIINI